MFPLLYKHFENEHLSVEIFVTQWLRTLFSQQFNLEFVFRLWDIFFMDGLDFMVKISLSMLYYSKDKLLTLQYSDILLYMKSLPEKNWDYDELIETAIKMRLKV